MKTFKDFSTSRFLIIFLLAFFIYLPGTALAQDADVLIDVAPSAPSVSVGDTFTVDINIDPNGNNIGAVGFDLSFDSSILQATNITWNGALVNPDPLYSFYDIPFNDGITNAFATSSTPYNSDVSYGLSSFNLVTIEFTAINEGSSNIDMTLTNPSGGVIESETYSYLTYSPAIPTNSITVLSGGGDSTPPTITSISSDKANGSYKAGEIIDVDVIFSEAVTSTGDVTVTLETGDTDRTCTFTISNSANGTCNYTVQPGDTSSDLDATISGIIADQASNPLTNYVPAATLATNKALVIDTTSPAGGSITYTDGYYTAASVALTASDGTDGGSGINASSRIIQRRSAALSAGSCGGYGSFSTISPSGSYPNFTDTSVSSGSCYQYQYLVSDIAGNQATYASSNAAKVDTSNPTVSAGADQTKKALFTQDATASDATSGIANYQWSKTSGSGTITFGTATAEDTTISASTDDTYVVRLTVTDAAGNSAYDEFTLIWDTTAPAAVLNLATSSPTTSTITVTWTAPGDDALVGTATSYDIRYSTATITEGNWSSATQATEEPTPSVSGTSESKTVSGLSSSTNYYFAIKTSDDAGNVSEISNIPTGTTKSSGGGGGGGGGGGSPTSSVTNMSISINGGAATTDNATVTLTIGATNATKMAISNSSDFSTGTWEAYLTTKSWNLNSGDGLKTVYIKFQDVSGYYSSAISDSITLTVSAIPEIKYPDGTLLKSASEEQVYVIKSGQKEWIKTSEEFTAGGYKWEDVKIVTSEELALIPNYGSNPPPVVPNPGNGFTDGTLIKTDDSFRVYVIMSQRKKWISTPEVFETLGYKWSNIAIVSKAELDNISDFEDNLIRAIGDYKVYLVVNGLRHHIPNPEIFLDYGFGWTDVKDVPLETVNKYPMARLIKESNQEKIYYLSASEVKKWIPTADIFNSYGNKWEDIQVISKKEMTSYPESNIMQYEGTLYLISGNYKRLIPSDAIFNKNKYNRDLVLSANKTEFDWYMTGSPVK